MGLDLTKYSTLKPTADPLIQKATTPIDPLSALSAVEHNAQQPNKLLVNDPTYTTNPALMETHPQTTWDDMWNSFINSKDQGNESLAKADFYKAKADVNELNQKIDEYKKLGKSPEEIKLLEEDRDKALGNLKKVTTDTQEAMNDLSQSMEEHPVTQTYQILSTYYNQQDPHPENQSLLSPSGIANRFTYKLPTALGSSVSLIKGSILNSAAMFANKFAKRWVKSAALKEAAQAVPELGQGFAIGLTALEAADVAVPIIADFWATKSESAMEYTDAYEDIYKSLVDKELQRTGKQSEDELDPNVKTQFEIKANQAAKDVEHKNWEALGVSNLIEFTLARLPFMNTGLKMFEYNKYTRLGKIVGEKTLESWIEQNQEGSQWLFHEIAKDKALEDKSRGFDQLDSGNIYVDALTNSWDAEKAIMGYGNHNIYENTDFKNNVMAATDITLAMGIFPSGLAVANEVLKYNSTKSMMSKPGNIAQDELNHKFKTEMYFNILNGGKADQFKEILRKVASNPISGIGITTDEAKQELHLFEQTEKAYEEFQKDPDIIDIAKMGTKELAKRLAVTKADKTQGIISLLTANSLEVDKNNLLKEQAAFDNYGFLLDGTDEKTKKIAEKILTPKEKLEEATKDRIAKMYDYRIDNLREHAGDILSGNYSIERNKLLAEYNKADDQGKLELEYLHGNKVNPLARHLGEKNYIKDIINYLDTFGEDIHNDKLTKFKQMVDKSSSLDDLVNYALANNLNLGKNLFDHINVRLNDAINDEYVKKTGKNKEYFDKQVDPLTEEINPVDEASTIDWQNHQDLKRDTAALEKLKSDFNSKAPLLSKNYEHKELTDQHKEIHHLYDNYLSAAKTALLNSQNEAYASEGALKELNYYKARFESLKQILNNVHPDNRGAHRLLNHYLKSLDIALASVKKIIGDKEAKENLIHDTYTEKSFSSIGLDFKPAATKDEVFTENPTMTFIRSLVGDAVVDKLLGSLKEMLIEKNGLFYSHPYHVEAFINGIKENLTNANKKQLVDHLEGVKEALQKESLKLLNDFETDSANKGVIVDKMQLAFMENPSQGVVSVLNSFFFGSYPEYDDKFKYIRQLIDEQDYIGILKELKNVVSNHTDQDAMRTVLGTFLNNYLNISNIEDTVQQLSGDYAPVPELKFEIEQAEGLKDTDIQSKSQQVSIRQILKSLLGGNTATLITGSAGTGKTTYIIKFILKFLDIDPKDVVLITKTNATLNTLRKSLGLAEVDTKNALEDFLASNIEDHKESEFIVFDEAMIGKSEDLNRFMTKLNEINALRESEDLPILKALITGDPTQFNDSAFVSTYFYGINQKGLKFINSLTVPYRSDESDILYLQNQYKGKRDNVESLDFSRTDDYQYGTMGVNNIDDILDIIQKRKIFNKSSVIIVNNDDEVTSVKKILSDKGITDVDVLTYINSQGTTYNSVYVVLQPTGDLKPMNLQATDQKTVALNYGRFNKAMYVATSRATDFCVVANTTLTKNNTTKEKIDKTIGDQEKKDNKKAKLEELKKVLADINKEPFTDNPVQDDPQEKEEEQEKKDVEEEVGEVIAVDPKDEVNFTEEDIDSDRKEAEEKESPIISGAKTDNGNDKHFVKYPQSGVRLDPKKPIIYVKHMIQDEHGKQKVTLILLQRSKKNTYTLAGIVSENEIPTLPKELQDGLNDDSIKAMFEELMTGNEFEIDDAIINRATVSTANIIDNKRRWFNYTKIFKPLTDLFGNNTKGRIDQIIEDYVAEGYTKVGRKVQLGTITKEIVSITPKEAKGVYPKKAHSYIKVTIPYINKYGKPDRDILYIDLVARKLNKTKDAKTIFDPLNHFFADVHALQELTGLTYGSQEPSKYSYKKRDGQEVPLTQAEAFSKILKPGKVRDEILSSLDKLEQAQVLDLAKKINSAVYGDSQKEDKLKPDPSKETKNLDEFDKSFTDSFITTGTKESKTAVVDNGKYIHHPQDETFVKVEDHHNQTTVWRKVFTYKGFHIKVDASIDKDSVSYEIYNQEDVAKNGRMKGKNKNILFKSTLSDYTIQEAIDTIIEEIDEDTLRDTSVRGPAQRAFDIIAKVNPFVHINGYKVPIRVVKEIKKFDEKLNDDVTRNVVFAKSLLDPGTIRLDKDGNVKGSYYKHKDRNGDDVKYPSPIMTLEILAHVISTDKNGDSNANINPTTGKAFGLRYAPSYEDVNGGIFTSRRTNKTFSKKKYNENATDPLELQNNQKILDMFEADLDSITNNRLTTQLISKKAPAAKTTTSTPKGYATQSGEGHVKTESSQKNDLEKAKNLTKEYGEVVRPKARSTKEMLKELFDFLNKYFDWNLVDMNFSKTNNTFNFITKDSQFSIEASAGVLGGTQHYIGNSLEEIINAKYNSVTPQPTNEGLDLGTIVDDSIDSSSLDDEEDTTEKDYSLNKERNTQLGRKVSKEEIIKLAKKYIPKITKEQIVFLTQAQFVAKFGKDDWGRFSKGIIYLQANIDGTVNENVLKHEAFHKLFHNFLSFDDKVYLFQLAKRLTGYTNEVDLEEYLAERFQTFLQTSNKFTGIIYKIFTKLKAALGFITNEEANLRLLFDELNANSLISQGVLEYEGNDRSYSKIIKYFGDDTGNLDTVISNYKQSKDYVYNEILKLKVNNKDVKVVTTRDENGKVTSNVYEVPVLSLFDLRRKLKQDILKEQINRPYLKVLVKKKFAAFDLLFDTLFNVHKDESDQDEAIKKLESQNITVTNEMIENLEVNRETKLSKSVNFILGTIKLPEEHGGEFLKPGYAFQAAIRLMANINSTFDKFDELIDDAAKKNGGFHIQAVAKALKAIYHKSKFNSYQYKESARKPIPIKASIELIGNSFTFIHGDTKITDKGSVGNFYKAVLEYLYSSKNPEREIFMGMEVNEAATIVKALHQKAIANDEINAIYTQLGSLYERKPYVGVRENKDEWDNEQGGSDTVKRVFYTKKTALGLETAVKNNLDEFFTLLSQKRNQAGIKTLIQNLRNAIEKKDITTVLKLTGTITKAKVTVSERNATTILNNLSKLLDEVNKHEDAKKFIANNTNYLSEISFILLDSTDYNFANNYYDNKSKSKIYLFINGNYASSLLKQFKAFNNKENTLSLEHLTHEESKEFFYKYNIFNPHGAIYIGKIIDFINHTNIENRLNQYKDPIITEYKEETKKQWVDRVVNFMFLQFASNSGSELKYAQQIYTPSNRPNVQLPVVKFLDKTELRKAIAMAYRQESLRQKRKEYLEANGRFLDIDITKPKSELNFLPNIKEEDALKTLFKYALSNYDHFLKDLNFKFEDKFKDLYTKVTVEGKEILEPWMIKAIKENDDIKNKEEAVVFASFYLNNYVNGHFYNQLLQGDLAQFKSTDAVIKRSSMPYSPGNIGRVAHKYGLNKEFGIIVAKDYMAIVDKVRDVLNKLSAIHNIEFERDNAIMFYTPARGEELRRGFSSDFNIGNILKPVFHGQDKYGITVDLKNSGIELTDAWVERFPELKEIRDHMIEMENLHGVNFELHFESGVKVGGPANPVDFTKESIKQNYDNSGKNNAVVILPNQHYRVQSNPRHEEDEVANYSQLNYFLDVNLNNPVLSDMLYSIDAKLMSMNIDKLIKKLKITFGDNGEITNVDKERIRETLLKSLEQQNGNESYIALLKAKENGKYVIDINYPGIFQKVITQIATTFSKTVKIRNTGSKLVLNPNLGIELFTINGQVVDAKDKLIDKNNLRNQVNNFYKLPTGVKEYLKDKQHSMDLDPTGQHWNSVKDIAYKNRKDTYNFSESQTELENYNQIVPTRLKYYTKEGKDGKYAEVIAPRWWKDKHGVQVGDILYHNSIGVRIPTTGLHSAIPLKIVGFSDIVGYDPTGGNDHEYSNTLIAPQEILPLHGSDYDVDSLFVLRNDVIDEDIVDIDGTVLYKTGDVPGYQNPHVKSFDDLDKEQEIVDGKFKGFEHKLRLVKLQIEQYRKSCDELQAKAKVTGNPEDKQLLNQQDKVYERLKLLEEQIYKNMKLYTYISIITAKQNEEEMGKPISFDKINGTPAENNIFTGKKTLEQMIKANPEDPFILSLISHGAVDSDAIQISKEGNIKISDNLKSKLLKDNEIGVLTKIKLINGKITENKRNLNDLRSEMEYHYLNFSGVSLTGQFANYAKALAYTLKGIVDKSQSVVSNKAISIDGTKYGNMSPNEQLNNYLSGKPNNIWEVIDMLINLAIDNVKEQKLDVINATGYTGDTMIYMAGMGIPFFNNVLLLKQPIIRHLINEIDTKDDKPEKIEEKLLASLKAKADNTNVNKQLSTGDYNIKTEDLINNLNFSLEEADVKTQYAVLSYFLQVKKEAKKMGNFASVLKVLQEFDVRQDDLNKFNAKLAQAKEDIGFQNSNPFELSHIKQALSNHDLFNKVLKHTLFLMSDKIDSLITDLKKIGIRIPEKDEFVKELTKYFQSSVLDTKEDFEKMEETVTTPDNMTTPNVLYGIDAWMHNTALEYEKYKSEFKGENEFLTYLQVKTDSKGVKRLEFQYGSNKGTEKDLPLMSAFLKLQNADGTYSNMQKLLAKYSAVTTGDMFGLTSYSTLLTGAPGVLAHAADKFKDITEYILKNGYENFKMHLAFSLALSANNQVKHGTYIFKDSTREEDIKLNLPFAKGTDLAIKKSQKELKAMKGDVTTESIEDNDQEATQSNIIVQLKDDVYILVDKAGEYNYYQKLGYKSKKYKPVFSFDILKNGWSYDSLFNKDIKPLFVRNEELGKDTIVRGYDKKPKVKVGEVVNIKSQTDPLNNFNALYTVKSIEKSKLTDKKGKEKEGYNVTFVRNEKIPFVAKKTEVKENKKVNFTPSFITSLKLNEIFVFGSNSEGIHGKGAALIAKEKFGAKQGQSEGIQGQSYAVITKKNWRVEKSSSLNEIQEGLSKMLDYASKNSDKTFLVTKLGSSLAGYSEKEIKQLFENLKDKLTDNVILPREYEVRNKVDESRIELTPSISTSLANRILQKLAKVIKLDYEIVDFNTLQLLVTFDRNAKGLIYNGKVYLNQNKISLDTPIHEFAHALLYVIKEKYPNLYNNLVNEIKSEKTILDKVKYFYPELSEQDQIEEAIVTAIGYHGANLINSMPKRLALAIKNFFINLFRTLFNRPVALTEQSTIQQLASLLLGDKALNEIVNSQGLNESSEFNSNFKIVENTKSVNFYTGSFGKPGQDKEYYVYKNGESGKKFRFRIFFTNSNNIAYISDILKLNQDDKNIKALDILPLIQQEVKRTSEEYGVNYELYIDPVISEKGKQFRNILDQNGLLEKTKFTFNKWDHYYDKSKYTYDDSFLYKVKEPKISYSKSLLHDKAILPTFNKLSENDDQKHYNMVVNGTIKKLKRVSTILNDYISGFKKSDKTPEEYKAIKLFKDKNIPLTGKVLLDGKEQTYDEVVQSYKNNLELRRLKGKLEHAIFQEYLTKQAVDGLDKIIAEYDKLNKNPFETYQSLKGRLTVKDKDGWSKIDWILRMGGYNADDGDKIHSEFSVYNEALNVDGEGIGGTIDLLVEHKDGSYSIMDLKTGFLSDERKGKFKYGNMDESVLNKGKLQIMLYAMLLKSNNKDIKFRNLRLLKLSDTNEVTPFDVAPQKYLSVLKDFILYHNKDFVNKNSSLFDHKEYTTLSKEVLAMLNADEPVNAKNLNEKIERVRNLIEQELKTIYYSYTPLEIEGGAIYGKGANKTYVSSRIKTLNKQLAELGSYEFGSIYDIEKDISPVKMLVSTLDNIDINIIKYFKHMYDKARNIYHQEVEKYRHSFEGALKPIYEDYISGFRKAGSKIGINAINYKDFYNFAFRNTSDRGPLLVTEFDKEFELLTPDQQKFIIETNYQIRQNYFKTLNPKEGLEYYTKRLANMANTDTKEQIEKWMDELRAIPYSAEGSKEKVGFKFFDGFFPMIPKTDEEKKILPKIGAMLTLKSTINNLKVYKEQGDNKDINIGVPLKYFYNLEDGLNDNFSYNLEFATNAFVDNMIQKRFYDPIWLIGNSIKVSLTGETVKNSKGKPVSKKYPHIISTITDFLRNNIEQNPRDFTYTVFGKEYSVAKTSRLLTAYTSSVKFVGKPMLAFKNLILEQLYNIQRATAGSIYKALTGNKDGSFTITTLLKSWGIFMEYTAAMIADYLGIGNIENNKYYNMNKKFNFTYTTFEFQYGKKESVTQQNKLLQFSNLFLPNSMGEEFALGTIKVATLMQMEHDGVSMWDLYDNKGNYIGPTRGVLRDGTVVKGLTDYEITNMNKLAKSMHGDYDPEEKTMVAGLAMGIFVTQFHKFMPNVYERQLQDQQLSGAFGNLNTVKDDNGNVILDEFGLPILNWESTRVTGNIRLFIKAFYITFLYLKDKKQYTNFWQGLSQQEREGIYMAGTQLLMYTASQIAIIALYGDSDSDDKDKLKRLVVSLSQDTASGFILTDLLKTIKNPIPAAPLFYNLSNSTIKLIGGQFGGGGASAGWNTDKYGNIPGLMGVAKNVPISSQVIDWQEYGESMDY